MSAAVQTPTGDCRHCCKPIRANRAGIWGARKRDDSHPWYCDASPDARKRHEPATAAADAPSAELPAESLISQLLPWADDPDALPPF
jgi:hypothetical protein